MWYLDLMKGGKFLFISVLVWSIMMMGLVENMLLMWIMLEINMLCFIPLMKSGGSYKVNSSMMKYFLVQALGSFFILYSFIINNGGSYSLFIVFGLLLKLGNPPSFIWLPSVMKSLEWYSVMILSTMQKLPPLIIFSKVGGVSMIILGLIMLGFLVSGVGGLMQTHLMSLMGYSSMAHMSWVMLGMMLNKFVGWFYFFIYFMSVMLLFKLMDSLKWYKLGELGGNSLLMILSLLVILSMAGLPPLMGFFPKLFVFQLLLNFNTGVLCVILFLMGFNLYYYSNLCFLIYSKLSVSLNSPLSGSYSVVFYWGVMLLFTGGLFMLL